MSPLPCQLLFLLPPSGSRGCQANCGGKLSKEGTCCPLGRGRALQQVGFDHLGVTRPLVMQTAPILGNLITLKDLERGLSRALTH